jgi:hypothetical protein
MAGTAGLEEWDKKAPETIQTSNVRDNSFVCGLIIC